MPDSYLIRRDRRKKVTAKRSLYWPSSQYRLPVCCLRSRLKTSVRWPRKELNKNKSLMWLESTCVRSVMCCWLDYWSICIFPLINICIFNHLCLNYWRMSVLPFIGVTFYLFHTCEPVWAWVRGNRGESCLWGRGPRLYVHSRQTKRLFCGSLLSTQSNTDVREESRERCLRGRGTRTTHDTGIPSLFSCLIFGDATEGKQGRGIKEKVEGRGTRIHTKLTLILLLALWWPDWTQTRERKQGKGVCKRERLWCDSPSGYRQTSASGRLQQGRQGGAGRAARSASPVVAPVVVAAPPSSAAGNSPAHAHTGWWEIKC